MHLFARAEKAELVEVPLPVKGWNRQSAQSEGCALFKIPSEEKWNSGIQTLFIDGSRDPPLRN